MIFKQFNYKNINVILLKDADVLEDYTDLPVLAVYIDLQNNNCMFDCEGLNCLECPFGSSEEPCDSLIINAFKPLYVLQKPRNSNVTTI